MATKETNKCFLCSKLIPKTCKGFSSGSWESSFVLCEILGVPHWEKIMIEEKNENLKINELFYCFKCLGKIMNLKNDVEELKKLEEVIGEQKRLIRQDLRDSRRKNGPYSGTDWHPTDKLKDNIVLDLNRNDKTQGPPSLRGKRKLPSSSSTHPEASETNSTPRFQYQPLLPKVDDDTTEKSEQKTSVVTMNTRSSRKKINPNPTGISVPDCPEIRDPLLPADQSDNILPIPTNPSQYSATKPNIKIKKEVLPFYSEETTNIYGPENTSDSETPDFHTNTQRIVGDSSRNANVSDTNDWIGDSSGRRGTFDVHNMRQVPVPVFHVPPLTSTSKSPKNVFKRVRKSSSISTNSQTQTCHKCGTIFSTKQRYENHLKKPCSRPLPQQIPSSSSPQCAVCHLLCVSYYSLKNHIIACHYEEKGNLLPSIIPFITK